VDDAALPITEHLAELRSRLGWIVGALALGTALSFNQAERIFGFLVDPVIAALPEGTKLQAIKPTEIFFTYLKCALLAGFLMTLPVFFFHVWRFVAPGLYPNERRAVIPFVLCSTLLFGGGAIFGYLAVFPVVFGFFTSFDSSFAESAWTMQEVFSLTTRLFLAFGVAFELPIVVFFLAVTGILSARQLLAGTPYAVLLMFILGAVLTPPDFVSQILLALPMIVLYLLGVGVAWLFGGASKPRDVQDDTSLPAERNGD
jgi:sec-independent protein translocase protein TatC